MADCDEEGVFNPYGCPWEQDLIEDLTDEVINQTGIPGMLYLPRRRDNDDGLYQEDALNYFDTIYTMKMYLKSMDGFEGEGDFLSKFGLEIRDSITFTISKNRFKSIVTTAEPAITRPREGDLIWFPFNKKMFKIAHTEHEIPFYQLGILSAYDIRCDLFEYSMERFQTGNTMIDTMYSQYDFTTPEALDDIGEVDTIGNNDEIEKEANTFIDFDVNNPFGDDSY